jgi:GT2 family glycosyltransferase
LPRIRYPNWSATVIDNASSDGTDEAIRAAFPSQRVLVMDKNLGFCGGNNRGIQDALARGAAYVLLLNNDTELHPDLLSELVQVAQSDERIGAVGAKNIMMQDHRTVWGAYGELNYGKYLVTLIGSRAEDGPEYTCVKDVDWVIGNGVLMSRKALEVVGDFDEYFFGYHEDVDWCERAHHAGFRTIYNGRAIIYHHGSSASGPNAKMPFPTMYFLGRNGLVFARKHGTVWQLTRHVTLFLTDVTRLSLRAWWRGERVKPFLWMIRGFGDAILGRLPLRELHLQ